MADSRFHPKLLTVAREGISRATLLADVQAGVTVGLVALPLAIAFAIASGVRPEQGLYTAVVAGLIVSALGGSRVQIAGPTGAFVVLVFGVVAQHGADGLATATLLAGLMLIGLGAAGFGAMIRFVPYPVTVGFTSGIAFIIATGQLRDLLGLKTGPMPPDVPGILGAVIAHADTWNPTATAVAALCGAVVLGLPRLTRAVPGPLAGLVVATVAVAALDLPVDTVGSRFPPIPTTLPTPTPPRLDLPLVRAVFPSAVAIALLGAIESLLSAVVADGMTGRRHRSDTELIAQGIANVASPIFLGIPATGAIARTATNVKSGGTTPIAGIVHALTVLSVLVLFGGWASYLPMPALAAILAIVAYNMSEWRHFLGLLRAPRSDVAVLLLTFVVTVVVDLVAAIGTGMVLSSFLFMRRMAEVSTARFITDAPDEDPNDPMGIRSRRVPPGVEVFEVEGPFFFGAADAFRAAIREVRPPRVLILRLRHVPAIDATGIAALAELLTRARGDRTRVVLSGLQAHPRAALARAGVLDLVDAADVVDDVDAALVRAADVLGERTPPPSGGMT